MMRLRYYDSEREYRRDAQKMREDGFEVVALYTELKEKCGLIEWLLRGDRFYIVRYEK